MGGGTRSSGGKGSVEGSIMLYLIILSTLSSQNVAVLSLVRAGCGVTVAGGGRMLCSLRSQVLKTVYSLYGITKTKQNKLAPLFWGATRDMTTRPGRVPRRVQVRTHLTLGMRAHWGCGHTGDARRRARARGNRVVFCGQAQRNNRRQQESSHRLRLLGRVRGQLVVDEKVHIEFGEPGVEAGDHIQR